MLYVTTRDNRDAYTPHHILQGSCAEQCGYYVPLRISRLNDADLQALLQKNFNSCIAEILNYFFQSKITQWDLDLVIGRSSVRLAEMKQKILLGECWHNPGWKFAQLVENISLLLRMSSDQLCGCYEWIGITARIAVLFGIFSELSRNGLVSAGKTVDVAFAMKDFSGPVSAWYAREMGLPVGEIICCCNENSAVWELFSHGQLCTNSAVEKTLLAETDVTIPAALERLIYAVGGCEETHRYLQVCRAGGVYRMDDRVLNSLRKGITVTVTGCARVCAMVSNLWKSEGRILSPYAALSYCGVLDYRAQSGTREITLVMNDSSPLNDCGLIADILGIPETEVARYV